MRSILLAAIGCIFLSSCASFRPATDADHSNRKLSKTELLKSSRPESDWSWLIAKAKIRLESTEQSGSATAQIRIRRDSAIWMHVSKVKVEAARLLIDTDSIYVIDRINKRYLAESIESIGTRFGLELDYNRIQRLVMGERIWEYDNKAKLMRSASQYQLRDTERDIIHKAWFSTSTLLMISQLIDDPRFGNMELSYADYEQHEAYGPLAGSRTIFITDSQKATYLCEISKIRAKWNQSGSMRFSVPSHYSRVSP